MVSFRLAQNKYKKDIYFQFVLFTRFMLGVKKRLGHALLGVQFNIPEEHPRPFHMGVSPGNSTPLYRTRSPQRKKETNKQTNKQKNKL